MKGSHCGFWVGELDGQRLIGSKGRLERLNIPLVEKVYGDFDRFLCIQLNHSRRQVNHFYPVVDREAWKLAEDLSRLTQGESKVLCGLHVLVGYHRGQCVLGHRPLQYFQPSCSCAENNRTLKE